MEAKVEYNMDKGFVSLEYGPFSTEVRFDWHRGIIALPKGEISISTYELGKILKLRNCKSTDLAWSIFDDVMYEHAEKRFGSSYTEFLHPGSPGYGFSISMPYLEENYCSEDDAKDYYGGDFGKTVIRDGYRKYRKIVEAYNNLMSELEKEIEVITRNVQEEQEEAEQEAE